MPIALDGSTVGFLKASMPNHSLSNPIRSITLHVYRTLMVMLGVALLASCATVQLASPQLDADAKQFTPATGKANIYVIRGTEITGGAYSPQIVLDGIMMGTIGSNTYFLASVDPGHHSIMSISKWGTLQRRMEVEGNRNYFIKFEWLLTLVSFDMSLDLSDDLGKEIVRQGKRAQSTQD
jgi:hypothetical protein